jgi:hypothetical protein
MTASDECPWCGGRQVNEYTHYQCPPGSTPDDHRHWVCANKACEYEWVEPLPDQVVAVTPEVGGH